MQTRWSLTVTDGAGGGGGGRESGVKLCPEAGPQAWLPVQSLAGEDVGPA